jgi:hypothetical protein
VTTKQEKVFAAIIGLALVGGIAFAVADSIGHTTVERVFLQYWPLRVVVTVAMIAFLGIFVYAIAIAVVRGYLGEGDWQKGITRFVVAALAAWFFTVTVRHYAFWMWEAGPYGTQYEAVDQRYTDLCTSEDEVDYGVYETDADWHAGDDVCAPLERRLHRLYPGPAWLFGNRPEP